MRFDNQTALITGASSGIGDAFARDFARRGADLIIVARRKDRLEALAKEIRALHDVTVTVIATDLSTPNAAAALAKKIGPVDIDILVNNAGFGHIGLVADEDPGEPGRRRCGCGCSRGGHIVGGRFGCHGPRAVP